MSKTLVRLLARHHGMELREDLSPEQDDLAEEPNVQPVGTVTDQHIKWLYGMVRQAYGRHEEQARLMKGPAECRPRQLRVARSLAIEMMMAFERTIRTRFGIHDDADLAVTREWKVYTWARPQQCGCGGCGGCGGQ